MKTNHRSTRLFLRVFIFLTFLTFESIQSQNLFLPDGVGEPTFGRFDVVRAERAGAGQGNVSLVRGWLQSGNVGNAILGNTQLFQGSFAAHIAHRPGYWRTAMRLRDRPANANNINGVVINTNTLLNNNIAEIARNKTTNTTFILRGNLTYNRLITVGSNTTIWIDGTITYNGPARQIQGGDPLSPNGTVREGFFQLKGANFGSGITRDVTIRGTKRGSINCARRNLPAIFTARANNLTVNGVTIDDSFDGIFFTDAFDSNIINCLVRNSQRRGLQLITSSRIGVRNNFFFNSQMDGVDVDAAASFVRVEENTVVGAKARYLYWAEIGANNNLFKSNVGVIINPASQRGTAEGLGTGITFGGFRESGTEAVNLNSGGVPNYNNTYEDNDMFYAERELDGFSMASFRRICFETIIFSNNRVYTEVNDIRKHNPKTCANDRNDVIYRTLGNPQRSNRLSAQEYEQQFNAAVAVTGCPGPRPFTITGCGSGNQSNQVPNGTANSATPDNPQVTLTNSGGNTGGGIPGTLVSAGDLPNGVYFINNPNVGNQTLGIDPDNNASVRPGGGSDVRWRLTRVGNTYTIESISKPGRFLEVPHEACISSGARPTQNPNSNVGTYTNSTGAHQRWQIRRVSTSEFILVPSHCTGSAIDRFGGTATANAQLFTFNNGQPFPNQRWGIVRTTDFTRVKSLNTVTTSSITIYPNPLKAGGDLNIGSRAEKAGAMEVTIHNLNGVKIYEKNSDNVKIESPLTLSTAGFATGIYIIKVTSNGVVKIQKLVVE